MKGYYYLHTNGELIFKGLPIDDDSDFVKKVWPLDTTERTDAWTIILESLAMEANQRRVKELADHWKCTLRDLIELIVRVKHPSSEMQLGLRIFLEDIHSKNYDEWMDWLAATPKGERPNFATMP